MLCRSSLEFSRRDVVLGADGAAVRVPLYPRATSLFAEHEGWTVEVVSGTVAVGAQMIGIDRPARGDGLERQIVVKRVVSALLHVISRILDLPHLSGERRASREPDVPFQPSPKPAVLQMLRLACVQPGDVVYDLGCGDGRIPIAASRLCGARSVGIDIDPRRIEESLRNARDEGVLDRVTFRNEDFFEANISDATVVTLFLWPEVNRELRTKLRRELKPGTRVVSYCWEIADWTPEQETAVDGRPIYRWTIPARATRAARRTMPRR
jgi:hypothetical protein